MKCFFFGLNVTFLNKIVTFLDKIVTFLDIMLPWANFKSGPWDIVHCLSGPLKLWATLLEKVAGSLQSSGPTLLAPLNLIIQYNVTCYLTNDIKRSYYSKKIKIDPF